MQKRPGLLLLSRARIFILVVIAFLLSDQFNLQQFCLFNPRALGSMSEEHQESGGKAQLRVSAGQRRDQIPEEHPVAAEAPQYGHPPRLMGNAAPDSAAQTRVELCSRLRC